MRNADIWLENRRGQDALGIDESDPRISWRPAAEVAGYELEFARHDGTVERAASDSTRLIPWPFTPLEPRDGGLLRVRRNDAEFRGPGLLVERGIGVNWSVDFASPSRQAPTDAPRPAYLLRAEFSLDELGLHPDDIARARLYITAHGIYEAEWNGDRIGDERLAPGWTSYRHRLRYRTLDVTPHLADVNAVGVWLADGWYRGHLGFDGGLWDIYGTDVAILAQLELTAADGRRHPVPLEWRVHPSPIRSAGLYEGELYDARLLPDGWSRPSFDAAGWAPAASLPLNDFPATIEAPTAPPVRETEAIRPQRIERTVDGRFRIDFGQNISGVLRIRPRGPAGTVIRLHHAEVLENGRLGVRPLRAATSVDTYVCDGSDRAPWTPRFTVHGFRYAEVEGWPGELTASDVEAVVLHTDMARTGWFDSSHPGLNQLHSNVVWSMRDNFVDLPTDCPQRDERLGWTGDIQVFTPTALRLFAAHGTLTGWLRDVAAEQADHGHVPNFVPWVECGFPNFPTAAWGDAAVIVPWEMYRNDGDVRVLADQYESMRAWVDLVDDLTGRTGLWNTGFQLGDWLDPAAPPDHPGDSHTDKALVATAYHARTARMLADSARLLGRADDADRYAGVARRAEQAFQDEFITPSGRVVSDTPTSLALCLVFGLFPDAGSEARGGERLVQLVRDGNFHISTGFVGTPIIADALVQAGAVDDAYHLLLQEELPSWLYPVGMGATTIWERWDSMLPDGSINPGDMTSFNHYALGAIADFLHRVVAGLSAGEPGWRTIHIEPRPGGGLSAASASYDTPFGVASSSWQRQDGRLRLDVTVPPGTEATVVVPGATTAQQVGAGIHRFDTEFRGPDQDPARPFYGWRKRALEGADR